MRLGGLFVPHHRSVQRPEPVACPICGRLLKWMPDRRLAEFECDHCGPFSDFAAVALVSEQRHRTPQLSLSHESARTKSEDGEQDEDDVGGTAD